MLRCFIFAILFWAVPTLYAQNRDTSEVNGRLSVQQAIRIALERNPEINQSRQQLSAAQARRWNAIGLNTPQLSYFREGMPSNPVARQFIQGAGFSEQRWEISQTIQFPLTSIYQYRKLKYSAGAAEYQVNAKRLRLKADVKKVYTDLALSIKLLQLSQVQMTLAKRLNDAVTTQKEVGQSSDIDLLKAQIQLAQSQNDLEESQRKLHDARYKLFTVIGLDPDEQSYTIEFPDTLRYLAFDVDQATVLSMLEDQPEIQSLNRRFQSAQAAVSEQRSRIFPDIGIHYYRQDYGNGFDYNGILLSLNLPIWFPFNQNVAVQEARAARNEVRWMRQYTQLEMKKNIELSWHGYNNNLRILQRYHQAIQAQSEHLLELTFEGYQSGQIDLLTLLDAQRTYLQNQRGYFQILHDYYYQLIELEKYLHKDIVYHE